MPSPERSIILDWRKNNGTGNWGQVALCERLLLAAQRPPMVRYEPSLMRPTSQRLRDGIQVVLAAGCRRSRI